jgi:hypothetical protein
MSRKSILDTKYELIKGHILDPENSPLPDYLQEELDRVISLSKVLDKNPTLKHAISLHKSKYPHVTEMTAYNDAHLARKVYNSLHEFDFDFWKSWLINDIVENINRLKDNPTPQNRRIIAVEHANLIKAIGEKPEDLPDPRRTEKHKFYLLVQVNNQNIQIDINSLDKLPSEVLKQLNQALTTPAEIDAQEAKTIMES